MANPVKRKASKATARKKSTKKKSVKGKTVKQTTAPRKRYVLTLYITGTTPRSQLALANIKRICDDNLKDDYELRVIDIYQSPQLAKDEQIIATPTLIKTLPGPLRRLIGDFSNSDRVLLGLDLKSKTGSFV